MSGGPRPHGALHADSPWVLRDYAFVADGERGALVDPRGGIAWFCAPAWHSGAVFSGLLGGPGHYRVSPLADRILDTTPARCLHPDGHWQRAADDPGREAALLLPLARGAVPPGDPSLRLTYAQVVRHLAEDGYVYRFRHGDGPLGDAEGAFLLCGFMTALAADAQGRTTEAVRWFERTRSACGPSGLFAEEYDVAQRQLRGNLPQEFVHALLLECSARLGGSCEDVTPDGW